MKRLACLFLGHVWRYVRPVNSKTYDYWSCDRCDAREALR